MKPWLAAAVLASLLTALLAGCGGQQDVNRNSNKDRPVAAPPASTPH